MKTLDINKHQIELLAPAGNYQAFLGAVNAGANAVYLAGKMFGARAFADNFSDEELLRALDYAHIHNSKIYMTVNTLLKNKELELLCDYIAPFYQNGLDGCIVQDLGVFRLLKENFPKMELHGSTQMTVSSLEGAKYLTNLGFDRVVLSRELQSGEIKRITESGIDTECFIHGSMCYCYSGQCLYSSLVGGRSGNRGRCAQPCRLKYSYEGKAGHFLSLKDMCTVNNLKEVLSLGIHSFKIEGRMKHEAYASGVTSIYRKYIDMYLSNPDDDLRVDTKDLDILSGLYIRSEIGNGYYNKSKGRNMITFESPSYAKTDDSLINKFTDEYCFERKVPVFAEADFKIKESAALTVKDSDNNEFTAYGDEVMAAMKAPVTKEDIIKKLNKTGESLFEFKNIDVSVDNNSFIPVGKINELRRNALLGYKELRLLPFRRELPNSFVKPLAFENSKKERENRFIYFVSNAMQLSTLIDIGVKCICVSLFDFDNSMNVPEIYIEMPQIIRDENIEEIINVLKNVIKCSNVKGFYVDQYDSLALIKEFMKSEHINPGKFEICGDVHFYKFNNMSITDDVDIYTIPLELKAEEIKHLNLNNAEMFVYGKYPLMNTANCILNTASECRKYKKCDDNKYIKDRYGKDIWVKTHCNMKICYNTLYNCVPTSLHNCFDKIKMLNASRFQIRFTDENEGTVKEVVGIYDKLMSNVDNITVSYEYTNGHYFRGVE